MSFKIYPGTLNGLQGPVSNAVLSDQSGFSLNSQNTIGYQTLLYEHPLDLTFPSGATQTATVNVGELPTNCLIYSTVCYSEGLTGVTTSGATVVSGDTLNTQLVLKINGLSAGGAATVLNNDLSYPNMITGELNPAIPTNPFITSLRTDSDYPKVIQLSFLWTGAEQLQSLKGDVIVKVALTQMNPNNLESDGYPTGGVSSGPVEGSIPLP